MRAIGGLLLLAACGAAQKADGSHGLAGSWREARSAHFIVRSDLPEPAIRERIEWMEESWAGLARLYQELVPGSTAPAAQVPVVDLADCADLDAISGAPGLPAIAGETRDFGGVWMLATCERDGADRAVILHELGHLFADHAIGPTMPAWLAEGLALYGQTIAVVDGELRLGAPPAPPPPGRPGATVVFTEPGAADVSVAGLLAAGSVAHDDDAAWHLVHLLLHDATLRPRFGDFVAALSQGVDAKAAWEGAFRGIDMSDLEDELDKHQLARELAVRGIELGLINGGELAMAPVGLDDVFDTWMTIASVQGTAALDREVSRIEADYEGWPDAGFWHSAASAYDDDPSVRATAVVTLRMYLDDVRPGDSRALSGVVSLQVADGKLDKLEPDVKALVRVARRPGELLAVAQYYQAVGKPQTGIGFAKRALAKWPGCKACATTLEALRAMKAAQEPPPPPPPADEPPAETVPGVPVPVPVPE